LIVWENIRFLNFKQQAD